MEKDIINILNTILETNTIEPEDIPNIDLYMDQVTTFLDTHLESSKRYEDDKIMTKTMVNNYTKNHLLPPPTKKKYSKEHIIFLIMIYYYKNVLSISDIQNLLSPISENYFPKNKKNNISLATIYEKTEKQLSESKMESASHIMETLKKSKEIFESDDLSRFAFINQLCYDIYLRKLLIERLLDTTYPPKTETKDKKNKK